MIPTFCSRAMQRLAVGLLVTLLVACVSSPRDDESKIPADKLYADAKEDMETGNWANAIKSLEKVESRAGGSLLAQQAQLDLAYAQWKSGEKAQSQSTLDRFIKLNPSSLGLDYALYLRGLINFNDDSGFLASLSGQTQTERDQQASREAHQSFKQLVDQFPESKYAPDARLRMDYIVNMLAAYDVHVARYYLRRGAHVAAANRAQTAVTEYPQAPAMEEALYILGRAYDKLGKAELRDDADRLLKLNFPQSRFLTEGFAEQKKAWWQLW